MEKRTPHCKLSQVLKLISEEKYRLTGVALAGGAALDLDADGIMDVVRALPLNGTFYKSMTSNLDHRVWQDVYHTTVAEGTVKVYLKLTVVQDLLVVSFKEK